MPVTPYPDAHLPTAEIDRRETRDAALGTLEAHAAMARFLTQNIAADIEAASLDSILVDPLEQFLADIEAAEEGLVKAIAEARSRT